ncbi:MFS transporter [Nonomuraea sp. NPDC059007]|uniref:MFS transporter n=1 Tax=Nonomuraea sp. NPDC059007 TaxID=3346692 RepID=UPI00368B008C
MHGTGLHRTAAWAPLAALATAQFLVVLSTSIVNVALPQIRTGLAMSPAGLTWVINAYVLVFGAILLPGGRLGDVYGLRRVFLTGATLFALAGLAAALATGPAMLIAARVAQGLGAALLAPAALALVLRLFPDGKSRGTALGVWGAVSGAGGAAGVLLSGLLTDLYGWRAVFAVLVPFALAVIAATWRLVPADTPRGGTLDLPGTTTLVAALLMLTYGLTSLWPAALVGLALLAVFVVIQRRSPHPLLPARMAVVARPNLLMALLGAVWLGLFYFLPLYQQRDLGYTPLEAGLSQLPLALMITIASWAAGRIRGCAVLPAGLLLLAAGLAWLGLTGALIAPSLLIGAGLGVAFVRLTAWASAGVPAEDSGLAGGLVNATRQVGGAVGLSALTLLPSYGGAFLACAALTLLITIVSIGKAP